MSTHKALLLGEVRLPLYAELAQHFEVERPAKRAWTTRLRKAKRSDYDLVLVDLGMPMRASKIIRQLKETHRELPVVMLVGESKDLLRHTRELEPLLRQPGFDVIRAPIDLGELWLRIAKATASSTTTEVWSMPELRSNASGRLDAARIAHHFGWTLSALSRALGASVQAVHKTPDAARLQKRLEKLERAALLARRLVGTERSSVRKWLNAPVPDLDGETPSDLLLREPDVIVQWLEDAALGQPA